MDSCYNYLPMLFRVILVLSLSDKMADTRGVVRFGMPGKLEVYSYNYRSIHT